MKKYVVVWVDCKPFYSFVNGEPLKRPDKFKLVSRWNGHGSKNLYICTYNWIEDFREVASGHIFCSVFKSLEEAKKHFDSKIEHGDANKNSPIYIVSCITLLSQHAAEIATKKVVDELNIVKSSLGFTDFAKIIESKVFF